MFSHLPVRSTRYRHRPRHFNFEVMERFELSCLFQSGDNKLCGPAVLLVSSRRSAVSCFATSSGLL